MPELPEVETTMQGLKPCLEQNFVENVIIRQPQLRWPIPADLPKYLSKKRILKLSRRGKYILMHTDSGTLILHLGMSGSLRIVTHQQPIKLHDHVDIIFSNQLILRFNDPRRFGACLWTSDDPNQHKLLASLGVEPLLEKFTPEYLQKKAANRHVPIKSFIMNSHIVVGVGNIYAAEALFLAGIHPQTPAKLLTLENCQKLVLAIQSILKTAIQHGGTTIRDFINSSGKPGYFAQKLAVYGRAGKPCILCQTPLSMQKISQRSTVFCADCQQHP